MSDIMAPPRSRLCPLHRWACTCEACGECATCRAFVTPGAAGAIRQRTDAIKASRRRLFAEIAREYLDTWQALR